MKSQARTILEHLKRGDDITPYGAQYEYGIMRLAARIEELRQAGHKIHTEMDKSPNGKRYARYRLIPMVQAELPFSE